MFSVLLASLTRAFERALTAAALLILTTLAANAQTGRTAPDTMVRAGTRVRVSLPSPNPDIRKPERRIGIVSAIGPADEFTVAWLTGDTTTVSASSVQRLEVSLGDRPFPARGLGIGLAAGTVIGSVLGLTLHLATQEDCAQQFLCYGPEFGALVGAFYGGAIGGVAGLIWGARGQREGWRRVSPSTLTTRVNLAPVLTRGQRGLRVRVVF